MSPPAGRAVIAVVFDFDETLAPDSTSGFLASVGIDPEPFWADEVQPLMEAGWDPVPAYLYRMTCRARDPANAPITRAALADWGSRVKLYGGATRIFARIRERVAATGKPIDVEFYLVSSGIGEILRNTRIAGEFEDIWACDFVYDDDGTIVFPKNVVSFTDKTRYIFQISKGLYGPSSRGRPFAVNRAVPPNELRVPLDRMVVVGDGYTDIPCFSLVQKNGGFAIGVYDPNDEERWSRAWGFVRDRRVANLHPSDYSLKSGLTNSLLMAVDAVAEAIEP